MLVDVSMLVYMEIASAVKSMAVGGRVLSSLSSLSNVEEFGRYEGTNGRKNFI